MDYVYAFGKGEAKILTPGVESFSDIKNELISHTSTEIVRRSTYPNGFVVEIIQTPDQITYRCNRELVDNGDGSFTAPTA